MLSTVALSGRLGKKIAPDVRLIEIDRVIAGPSGGKYEVDQVPVRGYGGKESQFMRTPDGALIVLRGHLECREGIGLVVIDELHEIYGTLKG